MCDVCEKYFKQRDMHLVDINDYDTVEICEDCDDHECYLRNQCSEDCPQYKGDN